jgi:3-keto-disaccharide hydrolase
MVTQLVNTRLIAALCCAASLAFAADNQLTPAEKSTGWELLFDGKTYANWEDVSKKSPPGNSFTIEDGCLKATPHARIEEDLFTTRLFADFELEWDWKISPAGNSGVKYRIQDHLFLADRKTPTFPELVNLSFGPRPARRATGQDYVIGFEYQMVDNTSNPDATRGGALHQAGALYDVVAPSKDATKLAGEFNHSRLVVRGDHVEHWVNGEKVVDASLKAPEVAAAMGKRWGADSPVYKLLVDQPRPRCPISLQNHGDAAWFKNIKVRELK